MINGTDAVMLMIGTPMKLTNPNPANVPKLAHMTPKMATQGLDRTQSLLMDVTIMKTDMSIQVATMYGTGVVRM